LRTFHDSWIGPLAIHATNIQERLAALANDVVAAAQEQARRRTRAWLDPLASEVQEHNLAARANLRLARMRAALNTGDCKDIDGIVAEIEADLALSEVMSLRSTSALADGLRQLISQRRRECGVWAETSRRSILARLAGAVRNMFRARATASAAFLSDVQPEFYSCVQSINGRLSFCDALRGTGSAGGASVGGGAGLCYSSGSLNYSMCGSGTLGWLPPGGDAWADGRAIVAALLSLPGTYNERRGEQNGRMLEASLQTLRQRADDLGHVVGDFENAARTYR
jgi:hypothetical protein